MSGVPNRQRLLRFGGGYGISVIIGAIVSIAVIPAVIIIAGKDAWATYAVAQAVGGIVFVFVAAGWGITGPTDVAKLPAERRGQYYVDSVTTRGWLFILTLVPATTIAIVLTREEYQFVAAVAVATSTITALSAGWFFVGESSPIRFLIFETLPRSGGTALGAVALLMTHNINLFVGLQFLGALASLIVTTVSILRRYKKWTLDLHLVASLTRLRDHKSAIAMAATATIYVNVPIMVVEAFVPAATAVYALAERILRLGLYATRPAVQVAQGYVPTPDLQEQLRRARTVIWCGLVIGVAGGTAYAAFAPITGQLLSGATLAIPFEVSIAFGVALFAMLFSQLTGFACLTAFNRTRALALSTIVGAIVGGVLLIPLALLGGIVGVIWAMAAAETAVLVTQLFVLRRIFRAQRHQNTTSQLAA